MHRSAFLSVDALKKIYLKHKEEILRDYFSFLRFASITTDPDYLPEVRDCHDWLVHYLKLAGMQVESWETERAPVIFAQDMRAGADQPTLLIYNHYDVQPVDPIELWDTPPFEPSLRDGEVYARGASDNKGQCFYTLFALKTLIEQLGHLPINVKYIIEGEEESGSVGLSALLDSKKERLKADYFIVIDSGLREADAPAITLGARGLTFMEVTLTEADFDLHSGAHGGIAYNPNRALVELLAAMHDATGAVTIPGFYEDVTDLSPTEREAIDFSFDQSTFERDFGYPPAGMERGVSPLEACWARPTIEINGICGGYTGVGFKTVIPSRAQAKISCRLVPHQDPEKISQMVKHWLIAHAPRHMKIEINIRAGGGGIGFRTSPHSTIAQAASRAYSDILGSPCKSILIGGSIPISHRIKEAADAEILLIGFDLPDDQIHSPNEHFSLDRLEKGYLVIAHLLQLLADTKKA